MAKILLAEDDLFLGKVHTKKLESEHEVLFYKDGSEVHNTAKLEKPDLILLDMVMPEKDGFQVLSELQKDEETRSIPVVVFSSLSQEEDIKKINSLGAKKYFHKGKSNIQEVMKYIASIVK